MCERMPEWRMKAERTELVEHDVNDGERDGAADVGAAGRVVNL